MAEYVLYDGQCAFCQRQVARLNRWDRLGRFAYAELHDPELGQRFPQLRDVNPERGVRLVDSSGRVWVGAAAVREILRRLPQGRWVTWLFWLPGGERAAEVAYDWVARRRHRL